MQTADRVEPRLRDQAQVLKVALAPAAVPRVERADGLRRLLGAAAGVGVERHGPAVAADPRGSMKSWLRSAPPQGAVDRKGTGGARSRGKAVRRMIALWAPIVATVPAPCGEAAPDRPREHETRAIRWDGGPKPGCCPAAKSAIPDCTKAQRPGVPFPSARSLCVRWAPLWGGSCGAWSVCGPAGGGPGACGSITARHVDRTQSPILPGLPGSWCPGPPCAGGSSGAARSGAGAGGSHSLAPPRDRRPEVSDRTTDLTGPRTPGPVQRGTQASRDGRASGRRGLPCRAFTRIAVRLTGACSGGFEP